MEYKKEEKRKGKPSSLKLLIILVIFFGFLKGGVTFSSEPKPPLEPRDEIFSLYFQNNKTGWIVGESGLIVKTTDGGKSWLRQRVETEKALYDVTFVDNEGWIVGQEGIILHSADGGKRWERQESDTEAALMSVFFLNKKRGFAVGEGGIILSTKDRGSTWKQYPLDLMSILPDSLIERGIISPNFYDIFFLSNGKGWIVGDNGIVLFSSDGGKKWEVLRIGLYPSLFSVFFKDDSEGWTVGQNGTILHTIDGGKIWRRLETKTEENLYNFCLDENYGIVVGDRGTILISRDGGRSWDKLKIELKIPLPWFIDVSIIDHASSGREVICVGENLIKRLQIR
ncbi:MAG: hypothetical protein DRG25_05020 [Deltaproteobacteria bacterium]|nr:MAG: hypothetical protein DRG25_05020 [Deltaproteobacteria bacterium]